jgi:PAS domain S-box-containing protein
MPSEENKSKEQKAAESEVESFRKDLGPFVVAAETTRMAMVFMDAKEPNHPLIFANDSFLSLTGYDREEVLGQSFDFLMARPADPEALAQVEAAFAGSSESGFEIRFRRKDGSMFWAAFFTSPIRDKTRDVVQHFASFAGSHQAQSGERPPPVSAERTEPPHAEYARHRTGDCRTDLARRGGQGSGRRLRGTNFGAVKGP